MARNKDNSKKLKIGSKKVARYRDKRSRPGMHYGTDDLVPVYDKDGKILYWREGTVHLQKT